MQGTFYDRFHALLNVVGVGSVITLTAYWVTGTVSVGPDITMCNVNVMWRVLLLTPIVHYNVVTGQRKWRWC